MRNNSLCVHSPRCYSLTCRSSNFVDVSDGKTVTALSSPTMWIRLSKSLNMNEVIPKCSLNCRPIWPQIHLIYKHTNKRSWTDVFILWRCTFHWRMSQRGTSTGSPIDSLQTDEAKQSSPSDEKLISHTLELN